MLIVNKVDKESKLKLPNYLSREKIIKISAKKQQLSELETEISKLFASDLINNLSPYPYFSQS